MTNLELPRENCPMKLQVNNFSYQDIHITFRVLKKNFTFAEGEECNLDCQCRAQSLDNNAYHETDPATESEVGDCKNDLENE